MSDSNWKAVRSKLEKISQRDLIGLIKELYQLNAQNQLFLETRFGNRGVGLEK